MRILAVSHTAVWPPTSGAAIRRGMCLEALSSFGEVDLLYVGERKDLSRRVPMGIRLSAVHELPTSRRKLGPLERLGWFLFPRAPYELCAWTPPVQPFETLGPYDVAWFFRPVSRLLSPGVRALQHVVDLDDLESEKSRQAQQVRAAGRSLALRLVSRKNARAWKRYEKGVPYAVDAVILSKEEDRRLLDRGRIFVVPNGYPFVPNISRSHREGSVLIFVGLFSYRPNADGAAYFVREVFPLIRTAWPGAVLRLVGRDVDSIAYLAGEGVELVGEVDDLRAEYDAATVSVVPIRFEGGTRVKVIEAFALQVPVVSTPAGVAGLGIRDGVEALVAPDPPSFARACIRLLGDPVLRAAISTAGRRAYEARFGQQAVTDAVGNVLRAITREGGSL